MPCLPVEDFTGETSHSSVPRSLTNTCCYRWTHFFSSPKTRNPLSFLVGYSNTLGLVGGLCSIDCECGHFLKNSRFANLESDGFSLMFLSVIVISRDGNWVPSSGEFDRIATFTSHGLSPISRCHLRCVSLHCRITCPHCLNLCSSHGQTPDSFRRHELRAHLRDYHRSTSWLQGSE